MSRGEDSCIISSDLCRGLRVENRRVNLPLYLVGRVPVFGDPIRANH